MFPQLCRNSCGIRLLPLSDSVFLSIHRKMVWTLSAQLEKKTEPKIVRQFGILLFHSAICGGKNECCLLHMPGQAMEEILKSLQEHIPEETWNQIESGEKGGAELAKRLKQFLK